MNRRRMLALCCVAAAACTGLGVCVGCHPEDPGQTPEGVVRAWLERMERVHGDPEDATRAYGLLSTAAKKNLEERARRASAATGRKMSPESMLVPSRFSLRFAPHSMHARVAGDRALVVVEGANGGERAEVPCLREQGVWRVDLVLPPLPVIEKRREGAR